MTRVGHLPQSTSGNK